MQKPQSDLRTSWALSSTKKKKESIEETSVSPGRYKNMYSQFMEQVKKNLSPSKYKCSDIENKTSEKRDTYLLCLNKTKDAFFKTKKEDSSKSFALTKENTLKHFFKNTPL